jgi:hypothetical protein
MCIRCMALGPAYKRGSQHAAMSCPAVRERVYDAKHIGCVTATLADLSGAKQARTLQFCKPTRHVYDDIGELTGVVDPVSTAQVHRQQLVALCASRDVITGRGLPCLNMPRIFQALLVCMCASGVVSRQSQGRLVAGQHQPLLRQLVGLRALLKPQVPLVYAHFA